MALEKPRLMQTFETSQSRPCKNCTNIQKVILRIESERVTAAQAYQPRSCQLEGSRFMIEEYTCDFKSPGMSIIYASNDLFVLLKVPKVL